MKISIEATDPDCIWTLDAPKLNVAIECFPDDLALRVVLDKMVRVALIAFGYPSSRVDEFIDAALAGEN